jgi:D-lactate dehydrogenase (cytochrome)
VPAEVEVAQPSAAAPALASCPCESDGARIREAHGALLADESRLSPGVPAKLYLPRSTDEVSAALAECAQRGTSVVVSGGRTGIVGGAVAQEGAALLSLSGVLANPVVRWSEPLRAWTVTVAAGMRLEELQERLRRGEHAGDSPGPDRLFYPVDPTEVSATLGGTVATDASGARTLKYGPTRRWVQALTVVLADGCTLRLSRGDLRAVNGLLRIERQERSPLALATPAVPTPATKHTAGYHLRPDMDALDLFVGGEGTLAVVTEVELRLLETPAQTVGLCVFLRRDELAEQLVAAISAQDGLDPSALEYMDGPSLELLRAYRASAGQGSGVPPIPDAARSVVYVEASLPDPAEVDGFVARLEGPLRGCGVPDDDVWAGFEAQELAAMKRFRHALPERINSLISERKRGMPALTKIGTDMAVPMSALAAMMTAYRRGLASERLEHCIFGHIGNGHVHVNILPRTEDEMRRGRALYARFAEQAVALGGSVAGEHGIGRLKRPFMRIQYGEDALDAMRQVKRACDPAGLLNPGIMLPD